MYTKSTTSTGLGVFYSDADDMNSPQTGREEERFNHTVALNAVWARNIFVFLSSGDFLFVCSVFVSHVQKLQRGSRGPSAPTRTNAAAIGAGETTLFMPCNCSWPYA